MARDRGTGSKQPKENIFRPQVPSLEPVGYDPPRNTPEQNARIRAEVIAGQALKQAAPDLRASRAAAPGPAITGYGALSALLGPDLAAHVPGTLAPKGAGKAAGVTHVGPLPVPGGVVGDAAMLLPFLRGPRAVVKGAAALARGEKAADAARAAFRETAIRGAARDAKKAYQARTLRANDLEAQLPKARSRITQTVVEKPADAASRRLDKSQRAKNTPVVRLGTASERVAKAAGRAQRQERARALAAQGQNLDAIKAVKAGSPQDVANFWYAQLPASHRNAEGLKAVQEMQRQHLDDLLSGRALEEANRREQAVNAALKDAADMTEVGKLLKEREQIQLFKSDIPQQIEDVSASIGQLDGLIAKPPAVNEKAIEAVRALGDESARVLIDAGRLNPERVEPRKQLLANTLGLEPSGDEAYIGHRLPTPDSRFPYTPQGGVGRPATPKGMVSQNKLVLARTGRLRPSLRVAAEDFQSVQVFKQANKARDDLGKLGTPFTGSVPADHVLVNPRGRTIPPNWKTEELAQFTDGYEDVDSIRRKAQEIVDAFSADGADPQAVDRLKQSALEQGVDWDELRVVPKRLVDRYYAQFRPKNARGTVGKAYDALIDGVATSIIFARIGYIPKNVVQNIVMAVPHQGALLLPNAVHAAQAMRDPQLLHLLRAEVGHGASGTLGDEALSKKLLGTVANVVGRLADDPLRISAFMHETAAAGVIRKVGLLTGKDKQALLRLLTDPAERPLLNDIRQRAVDAMADFSRLTPDQSRTARRLIVIPGWLMAGSRYPFHFAANHPIRSALLAYIAMGEPGAPDRLTFNKPIDQYFTGTGFKRGIDTPYGRFRTGSLSPVSTPVEIGGAVVQTARGKADPFDYTHQTVFDYAQPALGVGVEFAQGGGVGSLERLAPNYSLIRGLVSPKASSTYPEDATRLGRLKREVGVAPIRVSDGTKSKRRSRGGGGNIFRQDGPSDSGNIYAPPTSGGSSGNIFR